ncbi:hypothetical protein [Paenibacillus lautus]|uniref:hypothetical protein n=1 Tax=Paenibacillus lautus TaxID=1401 RepID=UPI003D2E679E
MDLTEVYKKKGFRLKYVFTMGNLNKPESLEIIDVWEKEALNPTELEQQKRRMMKNTGKPIINVEVEEI